MSGSLLRFLLHVMAFAKRRGVLLLWHPSGPLAPGWPPGTLPTVQRITSPTMDRPIGLSSRQVMMLIVMLSGRSPLHLISDLVLWPLSATLWAPIPGGRPRPDEPHQLGPCMPIFILPPRVKRCGLPSFS